MISPLAAHAELHFTRGLYAYCADQLGDPGSALDAMLTALDRAEPPRVAAVYALARREIQRRDVVYAPPVVDPLADPLGALVERAVRGLRPHQREVLLLREVCGLDPSELALALDVAADTAAELEEQARARLRQSLDGALSAIAVRLVTDEHHALRMATLGEILRRLPWPAPPDERAREPWPLTSNWPLTPSWPLPLAETDHLSSTGLFPLPPPARPSAHEAATAPMPEIRQETAGVYFLPRPREPVRGRAESVREPAGSRRRDWLWELAAFLACLAVAVTVFLALPS